MDSIPDTWPPPDLRSSLIVPLFPLKNVYLFPGSIMPLMIFEERYRNMIEDLLDGPGRLAIGTVADEGADMSGSPEVCDVAGLGEIGKHVRLPDGRFVIWLFGLGRVKIQEVDSDEMYRKVNAEPLVEVAVPNELRPALEERLHAAFLEYKEENPKEEEETKEFDLPDNLPVEFLTDLLLQKLQPTQPAMQEVFAEPVVQKRAERVLEMHDTRDRSGDSEPPATDEPEAE